MADWFAESQPATFIIDGEDSIVAIALDEGDAKLLAASPRLLKALHAARVLIAETDTPQSRAVLLMIDKAIAETR